MWVIATFVSGVTVGTIYGLSSVIKEEDKKVAIDAKTILDKSPIDWGEYQATHQEVTVFEGKNKNSSKVIRRFSWAYRGSMGPKNWHTLSPRYANCSGNGKQSPINIETSEKVRKLLPLNFRFAKSLAKIEHIGHVIRLRLSTDAGTEIFGDYFRFKHMDIRAPSEHRVYNLPYSMEWQLYHESVSGKKIVVSLLFEKGDHNSLIDDMLTKLPRKEGTFSDSFEFDLEGLLPTVKTYFYYQGSLTYPPCTSDLDWYILTRPISISASQINMVEKIVKFNARPIQPRAGRKVLRSLR